MKNKVESRWRRNQVACGRGQYVIYYDSRWLTHDDNSLFYGPIQYLFETDCPHLYAVGDSEILTFALNVRVESVFGTQQSINENGTVFIDT